MVFVISFVANNLFSQEVFLSINTGYGIKAGSQSIGENVKQGLWYDRHELVSGSYGKGFNFGAAFGYMFNKNIGT